MMNIGPYVEWSDYLLKGALVTIQIALASIAIGTIAGFLVGLLRFVPSSTIRSIVAWTVEIVRAVPLLLMLFFIFFALPVIGWDIPIGLSATLAMSLWMTVNTAEVVRGGIQSISAGQKEAGMATGLSGVQIMRYVILPQAVRRILPSYIGLCTMLTKDTSLAAIIGAFELTRATQEAIARTYNSLGFYLIAAFIYFCLCYPMSAFSRYLEKRFR
jgi:His/Glu/Gln/Arg/opine family amino acid ABC transporter permease subunit